MRRLRAVKRSKSQLIVWLMLHIVRWMSKIGTLTSASSRTIRYIRFPYRLILSQSMNSRLLKVYGPHLSALYVRAAALKQSVTSLVHHFLKVDHTSSKLHPGGPGYELVYATTGVVAYLLSLTPANTLEATWDVIAQHEQTLVAPLIHYLTDPKQWERGVRLVGDASINLMRAPTISFVVVGDRAIKSRAIVEIFDEKGGVSVQMKWILPTVSDSYVIPSPGWHPIWTLLCLHTCR